MRVLSIAAMALLVFFGAAIAGTGRTAEAAPVSFSVQALGANEVGGVSSPGSALGRFTFDADTQVLTYAVTVSGLSANLVTAAHIHRGAAGVNGPIIYPLSLVGFTQVSGSISLTDADVKDLMAGNLYLNVHSTEHPGGFARGQLILPAGVAASPTVTPGARVSPPNTGDAGLAASSSDGAAIELFLALAGFIGMGAVVMIARRAH